MSQLSETFFPVIFQKPELGFLRQVGFILAARENRREHAFPPSVFDRADYSTTLSLPT